jgi:hypothetical protein
MIAVAYGDAWVKPRHELIEPLRRVSTTAAEEGDFEYACLSDALRVALMGFCGYSIATFQQERQELGWTRWAYAIGSANVFASRIFAVLTHGEDLERISTEIGASPQSAQELHVYTTLQMLMVLTVLGEHARAFDAAERVCEQAYRAQIGTHVADFCFLRGLCAADVLRTASGPTRRAARRALKRSLRDLRGWSHPGSDFVHMSQLLEAERLRLRGGTQAALALYSKGASAALDHGHRHQAALAHERRAELLGELRRETEARASLRQAMLIYAEWGASAKATLLDARLAGGEI